MKRILNGIFKEVDFEKVCRNSSSLILMTEGTAFSMMFFKSSPMKSAKKIFSIVLWIIKTSLRRNLDTIFSAHCCNRTCCKRRACLSDCGKINLAVRFHGNSTVRIFKKRVYSVFNLVTFAVSCVPDDFLMFFIKVFSV